MSIANIKEALLQEVNILPPVHYSEVLGFIESLKTGQPTIPETVLLSESALSTDWDTTEEDRAWTNL